MMCVPNWVVAIASWPTETAGSKITSSNCGTIMPGLKVPRSPPLADDGQLENSSAAALKVTSPAAMRSLTASASVAADAPLKRMCDARAD